jgi:hypothetical protein
MRSQNLVFEMRIEYRSAWSLAFALRFGTSNGATHHKAMTVRATGFAQISMAANSSLIKADLTKVPDEPK